MNIKKYLAGILVMVLCITSMSYIKAYSVSATVDYKDAMTRLENLGILDAAQNNKNGPDSGITREEFAKALAIASGLEDNANGSMGATIFTDVDPSSSYSGYINAIVNKGLMPGMADGRFHPTDSVKYLQAYTIMVKALGFTDQDVPGMWPKNYLMKSMTLGLVTSITLSNNADLPRWAAAVMINRLLYTNVKKANVADADKTFADASGIASGNYSSGIITNPVYSKPEVATNFDPWSYKVGTISLNNSPTIIKNGEVIDVTKIEDNDVLYKVSDVWNTKSYILVVSNKVQGKITGFTPNKMLPAAIQIDNKSYPLSKDMRFDKISSFNVGDYATLLLGYDTKVVDFSNIQYEDNKNFAFVLNCTSARSAETSNYGAYVYTVKLLLIDGTVATYDSDIDASSYKGKLATYSMVNGTKVSLSAASGSSLGDVAIDKDNRKLGSYDIARNVKIFDFISNYDGQDANATLRNWSDMPTGTLLSGTILFANQTAPFNNINVLLTNNLIGGSYKSAIVTGSSAQTQTIPGTPEIPGPPLIPATPAKTIITGYRLTLLIDGKSYSYTSSSEYGVSSVVNVDFSNNLVNHIVGSKWADASSSTIQAFDGNRIRISDKTYNLKNNVQIYFRDNLGNLSLKGIGDIDIKIMYSNVSVYLDKPLNYGGEVDTIIIVK